MESNDDLEKTFAESISINEIQNEKEEQISDPISDNGLLLIKSANEWIQEAKNKPIPRMLFSEFWLEGELCILFADTNLGKSILAVQIANSITKGEPIEGFRMEAESQSVIYYDFELSGKQFQNRYSINYANEYCFDDKFYRSEINPDGILLEDVTFETHVTNSIEKTIKQVGARILIIDNITYLRTENEKAKDALPLMKELRSMQRRFNLSILVLAHTPKRDLSKPITINDVAGSKMLMNFCDSSFAIGESHTDKSVRYFLQVKQRNTESIYGPRNICVCQIIKESNFLQFEFMGNGIEKDHLKEISKRDRSELIKMVKELHAKGSTQREIEKELGISLGSVNAYLKK